MSRKQPESNVQKLFPDPKVDFWRREETDSGGEGVLCATTVFYRDKQRKQRKVVFSFFLPDKAKGPFKSRLELRLLAGTANLSEKEVGDLRRKAKDTLERFYKDYKKEPKKPSS